MKQKPSSLPTFGLLDGSYPTLATLTDFFLKYYSNMAETKFTPAPWSVCHDGKCRCGLIYSSPKVDTVVAQVVTCKTDFMDGEGFNDEEIIAANANLIAASPELYNELEFTLEQLRNFEKYLPASVIGCQQLIKRVENVLSKARGENPPQE